MVARPPGRPRPPATVPALNLDIRPVPGRYVGGGSTSGASEVTPAAVPTPETPTPTPAPAVDTFDWAGYYAQQNEQRRASAFDEMYGTFRDLGIDVDGSGLAAQLRSWVYADKSAASIMLELRKTKAYNDRFTGMADLIKRGQAISEAEYIAQERAYGNVMRQWGLPTGFYDDPTDFGRHIANGVSVKELDDRIRSAKTFLDRDADPYYKSALQAMGIDTGSMLAYVLDGDRAQAVIARQFKEAAFKGAADKNNFDLTTEDASLYGATLGQQYDTIGVDQLASLEKTLSEAGLVADNQDRLAAIDGDTAYARKDILDAQMLNDNNKLLASQRRAEREKARFGGSSAFGPGSLTRLKRV